MNTKLMAKQLREQAHKLILAAEALEAIEIEFNDTYNNDYLSYESKFFNTMGSYKKTCQNTEAINDSLQSWSFATTTEKLTRLELLKSILKDKALSLNEIVDLGIPKGTASSLMTEKSGFKKNHLGKWLYVGKMEEKYG